MSDTHEAAPAKTSDVTPEQVQEISRRVKGYLKIGILQVIFSLVTVFVSFLSFRSGATKILLTLLTAGVNAYLVAGIMMHLKEEKKTIWNFLIITAVFFFFLFFLTGLAHGDPIFGTSHSHH